MWKHLKVQPKSRRTALSIVLLNELSWGLAAVKAMGGGGEWMRAEFRFRLKEEANCLPASRCVRVQAPDWRPGCGIMKSPAFEGCIDSARWHRKRTKWILTAPPAVLLSLVHQPREDFNERSLLSRRRQQKENRRASSAYIHNPEAHNHPSMKHSYQLH